MDCPPVFSVKHFYSNVCSGHYIFLSDATHRSFSMLQLNGSSCCGLHRSSLWSYFPWFWLSQSLLRALASVLVPLESLIFLCQSLGLLLPHPYKTQIQDLCSKPNHVISLDRVIQHGNMAFGPIHPCCPPDLCWPLLHFGAMSCFA